MLNLVCKELRNWFEKEKCFDKFIIQNSVITPAMMNLKENQYFRIVGSTFNDGVYKYPATDLIDEEFEGAIWLLAIPKEVVDLAADVEAWITQYGQTTESPYNSESFGGYSYSKSDSSNSGWKKAFANRLNSWRKV